MVDLSSPATAGRAALSWPVRLVAAIPVAGALVLSFSNLADLARSARFESWLAYLWPGTLDATGVVASLIWLDAAMPADARRGAMRLALAAIALSIAGNSLRHWLLDTGQRPHVIIQMAIAAVPPAVLFLMLHVLHLAQRAPARPAGVQQDDPTVQQLASPAMVGDPPASSDRPAHLDGQVTPVPLPATTGQPLALAAGQVPPVQLVKASRPAGTWHDHIEAAEAVLAEQPGIGRPALRKALGDIPDRQARHLLEHLRPRPGQDGDS